MEYDIVKNMDTTKAPPSQPQSPQITPNKTTNPKLLLSATFLVIISIISIFFLSSKLTSRSNITQVPTAAVQTPLFLAIESPRGPVTAVDGEVLVKGKTLPYTTVMAYSDTDETSIDSDADGNFETSVIVGENGGLIGISAFSDTGEEKSEALNIQQSEVLGKNTSSNQESDKHGGSDNKSAGNVKSSTSQSEPPGQSKKDFHGPKGLPTPPTDQQLTGGETKNHAEVENEIKTFKNKGQEKKAAKIGAEKIKELTSESSGSAELTKKQLKKMESSEASSAAQLKRHAISGVITALGDGLITIAHQIQRDRITMIAYNASTVVVMKDIPNATVANLQVGMRIAAVGQPVDAVLLATRIHVIPGKANGIFRKFPIASPSATLSSSPTPIATESGTITPSVSISPTPSPTP